MCNAARGTFAAGAIPGHPGVIPRAGTTPPTTFIPDAAPSGGDAWYDATIVSFAVPFPAVSKFLASGSVVKVVQAYRLKLSFMLSSNR